MKPTPSSFIIALIVFLANAGLLVLQLLASRWLVPFIGSSLETWTAIIAVFLLGIALGNAVGGRLADRYPSPRLLAVFLMLGALAALGMMGLPALLHETLWATRLPLQLRVPVLAFLECFPAGFVLSLITPLAIKLRLANLTQTGRTAGGIFALGTLGCLAGNYLTGFYLIPQFTISTLTIMTAALFAACALLSLAISNRAAEAFQRRIDSPSEITAVPAGRLHFLPAAILVFFCSFCGMTLELTATRLLAQVVGVSLYTWTGVIGVMLAGTAAGNALGGWMADRGGGPSRLALSLILAAALTLGVLPMFYAVIEWGLFRTLPLMLQILMISFLLVFLPMVLLGTISPQVIKLTLHRTADAGSVAGRIYGWSTAGAIAGTFATGFVLISTLGMYRTILLAVGITALATLFVPGAWQRRWATNTVCCIIGLMLAGFIIAAPANTGITLETNYFTIRVRPSREHPGTLELRQDRLAHSFVKLDDPNYLNYFHEHIQREILCEWQSRTGQAGTVLVIGGGGYTFPRAAKAVNRNVNIDVVEIDPGVTAVSYSHLGLDPVLGIRSFHMDGRQFVTEVAQPGAYHFITLDAVNDLSVPAHLLTKEFNDAVKAILVQDGVYLVTVIDSPQQGRLWKSAIHTLRKTFAHVTTLTFRGDWKPDETAVHMLYASDQPLQLSALLANARARTSRDFAVYEPPAAEIDAILNSDQKVILTDEFAPVDYFMSVNFRNRK